MRNVTTTVNNRCQAGLLISLLLTTAAPAPSAVAATAPSASRLIEFSLKDQFDDLHTDADAAGNVVLMIGSDGEGSDYNDLWGSAINEAIADHPHHDLLLQMPYADLRSVPFFAKGFARGMMPEAPEEWVMMDWKGKLAKAYAFTPGATNVLVFAPDGTLEIQTAGREPDPAVVEQIVETLAQLLTLAATDTQAEH